jgi:hypothetical protein
MNEENSPKSPSQIKSAYKQLIAQRKNKWKRQPQNPIKKENPSTMEKTIIYDIKEKNQQPTPEQDPFKPDQNMETFTERTSQEKATREDGQGIIAKKLAVQLGTAPAIIVKQEFDDYKLGNFTSVPSALACAHFERRGIEDGVGYYAFISNRMKSIFIGVNGRGRNDILKLAAYTNPGGSASLDPAKKPNVIARNLFRRNWENDAQRKGQTVE